MMLLMRPLILSAVYWCCLVRSTESVLWPAGSYGIPKAASGCPSADGFQWLIGRRYQDTEDNNPSNHKSQQFHLDATVDSKRGILRSFCMKTDTSTDIRRSSWPPGKYCIYKKGGSCPPNLTSGFIKWDDEDDNNVNNKTGTLPDGVYDYNTKIEFCCRTDGDKNDPINLPTLKPFFLLAYDSAECQQVKWAIVSVEWIRFDNEDNDNADGKGGSYPHGAGINDHTIHYCYYQGCNKTLTGVSGLFNSPNHPGKYPDGQYCSWRITVTPAQQIHLKFTNFSLQSQNNTDSVSVYDGESATGKVLGVFYGGHPPPGEGVYSSSNYMFVIFKSDTNDSYAGFNASYKAIISAYNSRLTSVSSNSAILRTTSSCRYPTASTETLFASLKTEFMELTPSKRPQLLTSSIADQIIASSRIQVAMTSSVSSNVPEAAGCNEVLTKESGTFHSPNYPSKYPDGQYCSWRITVSPATQIHLTFTNFSLQRDIGTDVLSVYDGENATGEVLGVFYRGQPPPKEGIYSSSNDMFVIFKSDRNDSYTGFNASYKAVNCSVDRCSTVAVSTSLVTGTPSSPVVYFSGSLSLDMRPTLSTELSVTSHISMPAIESSPTTLVPLPSVTEYVSSISSRVIASSKTQQLMTSSLVGPLVQTKDCNKTLTGPSGSFHSPNFPRSYPNGPLCSWRITVSPAQKIQLTFTNFSLQSENNTDIVIVHDGANATGEVLGVFYGEHPPPKQGIQSSSNHMFVILKSDKNDTYAGFMATYRAVNCSDNECSFPEGLPSSRVTSVKLSPTVPTMTSFYSYPIVTSYIKPQITSPYTELTSREQTEPTEPSEATMEGGTVDAIESHNERDFNVAAVVVPVLLLVLLAILFIVGFFYYKRKGFVIYTRKTKEMDKEPKEIIEMSPFYDSPSSKTENPELSSTSCPRPISIENPSYNTSNDEFDVYSEVKTPEQNETEPDMEKAAINPLYESAA